MGVAALSLLCTADVARGQINVIFPGSTVQGDMARGYGVAAAGEGQYNLLTSMAISSLVDSMLRLDQYVAWANWAAAQRYSSRLMLARQRRQSLWASTHDRMLLNPTQADIDRGDSLNLLARRIAETQISYSAQRSTGIDLRGETLDLLPLYHPQTRTVVSISRLNPREGWPLLFREARFSAARGNYQQAVDTALGQIAAGKLSRSAVAGVALAVEGLRGELAAYDPSLREVDRRVAGQFLDQLERSAQMLSHPAGERILAEVMRSGTTSLADLLSFMNRHHLQFGRAELPAERSLYAEMRRLLAKHLKKLIESGAVGDTPEPAPTSRPSANVIRSGSNAKD
jgi:hypothetical protein